MSRASIRWAVWCALAAIAPHAQGEILSEGGVTLQPNGQTVVGNGEGDGTLWVTPPSTLAGIELVIARGSQPLATNGRVYVPGGAITMQGAISVGSMGRGLLDISQGGVVDTGMLTVGGPLTRTPLSEGVLKVDGATTKLRVRQIATIGDYGYGEAYITGGALFQSSMQVTGTATGTTIGSRQQAVGSVVVDGPDSAWQSGGAIVVGGFGTGSLKIVNGAQVSSGGATVGAAAEVVRGLGTVDIAGPGSRWITGDLVIGDRGLGEVRVADGGLLQTGDGRSQGIRLGANIGSFGRLVISGVGSQWVDGRAATIGGAGAGELWIEDGAMVSNAGANLGVSFSGGSGLAVVRGERTRWQTGGVAIGVEGSGWLRIEDGATVAVAPQGQVLTRVGTRGRLTLDGGSLLYGVPGQFASQGIIEGHGVISALTTSNGPNGRILVEDGDVLSFTGALTNGTSARIEITGGELAVGQALQNQGGVIVGDGATIRTGGITPQSNFHFENLGSVTFVNGGNRVYGRTTNRKSIVAAHHSKLTFYNDVTNLGSIKASEGAEVTFLGLLQGSGVTGSGKVYLEGPIALATGAGPMAFEGDVTLGELSTLGVDLNAATPGSGLLDVAGTIDLSGTLQLQAAAPISAPATLELVRAGELLGQFERVPDVGSSLGSNVLFGGIQYNYANDSVFVSLWPNLQSDFDASGNVDGNDFLSWQRNYGATAAPLAAGDANQDGVVDMGDYGLWQQGMGLSAPEIGAAQQAVPEPSGAVLLLLGLCGLCRSGGWLCRGRVRCGRAVVGFVDGV